MNFNQKNIFTYEGSNENMTLTSPLKCAVTGFNCLLNQGFFPTAGKNDFDQSFGMHYRGFLWQCEYEYGYDVLSVL